ncbi:MAG: GGDEF domain-containing protein [Terracidiphilus sp.]
MKRLAAILAIFAIAWSCRAAEAPRVLHSVKEVRALSHADAARGLSVEFEATVTYFRSYEKTLFVQDGAWGVYVSATTGLNLVPGDRVLVRGVTQDSFHPIVVSDDLKLMGHGRLPEPVKATFAPLIQAAYDCRWIKAQGRVVLAEMNLTSGRKVTHLVLSMDGGNADIVMDSDDPAKLTGLVDARVEMTAVAGETFDGKMQQTGVRLHVSSFAFVEILNRAPVDAWAIPLTPMDEVLRGYHVEEKTPRVRVEGTLTYYHQTSMAVLQDGSRSIRVLTSQIDWLKVGDRVEAIGIPFVDNGFLTLKLGSIRALGKAAPIQPQPVTWDQLASGKYAFNLVSMEGTVVSQVREHAQDMYMISADGHLFTAAVRHPFVYEWNVRRDPPPMPVIRLGSRVRVTGVAILDNGNPFNGAMAFGILLRSAGDVAVLAPASWLTVRNLLGVVSALSLIVLVITIWVALLRRKVHGQTAELAKRIEAEAMLERRRSKILEDINGARPLTEILEQIAALVSTSLMGAACWIQVGDAAPIGTVAEEAAGSRIQRQEIRSRAGSLHGTLYASPRGMALADDEALQALSMGAWLATLAIETRSLYSDLVHRSDFDLLTDIHNRFSLERQLNRLVVEAHARRGCFGLIYIDLDDFKPVNDRYGHRIGDLYLQEIAERMKRQLRPGDMLARLGGDEFAALVPEVRSRADVEEIADRLERCFDEPLSLDGYSLRGSGSIGIAVFPQDGATKDALLSAADTTMYEAKRKRQRMVEELRLSTE